MFRSKLDKLWRLLANLAAVNQLVCSSFNGKKRKKVDFLTNSRYYDTNAGVVLVDGHDTTKTNTKFLRSNIGIVAQEPTLFDATIGENIRYGALDRQLTDEEVIEASKTASLHDFVKDLPLGYETPTGLASLHDVF